MNIGDKYMILLMTIITNVIIIGLCTLCILDKLDVIDHNQSLVIDNHTEAFAMTSTQSGYIDLRINHDCFFVIGDDTLIIDETNIRLIDDLGDKSRLVIEDDQIILEMPNNL